MCPFMLQLKHRTVDDFGITDAVVAPTLKVVDVDGVLTAARWVLVFR